MNDQKPTVLVCPLDWGLGHATRCIPIIDYLLSNGYNVTIAGYGQSLALLRQSFPHLEHHYLKGFSVKYSRNGLSWPHLLMQLPAFFYYKWAEHCRLKKLVTETDASFIISDNRYGLYHKQLPCFIITHQLNPIMPNGINWMGKPVHAIIKKWVKKFHRCLIPDYADHRCLAGDLIKSARKTNNVAFIGHLSRFTHIDQALEVHFPPIALTNISKGNSNGKPMPRPVMDIPTEPFLLAIVSGPEPQRSLFSEQLQRQSAHLPLLTVVLDGQPDKPFSIKRNGNCMVVPHIDTQMMQQLIEKAHMVVCRAGYTSIMDLGCLGQKAILVPTPGQTEQTYLAKSLYAKGLYYTVTQDKLDLGKDMAKALSFYAQ